MRPYRNQSAVTLFLLLVCGVDVSLCSSGDRDAIMTLRTTAVSVDATGNVVETGNEARNITKNSTNSSGYIRQTTRTTRKRHLFENGDESVNKKQARIVGGDEILEQRYPFLVTIYKRYEQSGILYQLCGGVLITSNVVLSAAHCAAKVNYVHIGRHDLSSNSENYEKFKIEQMVLHPQFDLPTFDFDFALFKLSGHSKFSTVRLNRDPYIPRRGQHLHVLGWGKTSNDAERGSRVPYEARVKYVRQSKCARQYSNELVSDRMLCASENGKDACQGDSGGPLIAKGNDASEDIIVGLVSWGYGCADPDHPGVYSRVSYALDWIEETTCLLSPSSCGVDVPTASPTSVPTTSGQFQQQQHAGIPSPPYSPQNVFSNDAMSFLHGTGGSEAPSLTSLQGTNSNDRPLLWSTANISDSGKVLVHIAADTDKKILLLPNPVSKLVALSVSVVAIASILIISVRKAIHDLQRFAKGDEDDSTS